MIPDLDIYRAARLLIDRHGETAQAYAAGRVEQMLEGCDIDGESPLLTARATSPTLKPSRWRRDDPRKDAGREE